MRHLLFTDKHILESYINLPDLRNTHSDSVENRTAFVTGATGFIGGFLLKELLQNGTFESIICLVRSNTKASGFQRVKENLIIKGCDESSIDPSILKIETGDILAPSFGLEDETLKHLAKNVDHVFHFAASMNWITPFNQDTVLNIEALKSIIGLCFDDRLKKLHYASSMGLWTLQNHKEGPVYETVLHDQGHELPGGYFQSKWVNEKILELAKAKGLPLNIYRIGDVKGSAEDGLGDPQNFGNLVMKYFIENGIVIDSDVPEFNFIPVDYLAKAIAHISINETGRTFQFSNPDLISFKDIYESALSTNHDCRLVTKHEWVEKLKNDKSEFGKLLKPIFRPFTPDASSETTSFYNIGVAMFQKKHDVTNTLEALSNTSISCPAMIKDSVLNKYLTHLSQSANKT
ncbi:MAG: SDR family oxidoreductase [Cyclobacteriaceae bacterium]